MLILTKELRKGRLQAWGKTDQNEKKSLLGAGEEKNFSPMGAAIFFK